MDGFKKCGFLVTSCFLLLTLLGDPAEACSCGYIHPQSAYCYADFVIRGKFVGSSMESGRLRLEIETTEVYKRSEKMPEVRYVFTSPFGSLCGYEFYEPFGKREYVITGSINDNFVQISLCSFIRPWAQLSPQQQSGISGNYKRGCRCKCPPYKGTDADNKICLPKSQTSDSCSWQSLNS